MEFSLKVDDGDHVRHVEATSAEDALRQLLGASAGRPFRATFLAADAAELEPAAPTGCAAAGRRRYASEDTGHTRTHATRRVPR